MHSTYINILFHVNQLFFFCQIFQKTQITLKSQKKKSTLLLLIKITHEVIHILKFILINPIRLNLCNQSLIKKKILQDKYNFKR